MSDHLAMKILRHSAASWLHSLIPALLALLLAVQVSLGHQPPRVTMLGDGRIEIVICAAEGMRTAILNLENGQIVESGADDATAGHYCPFCLSGLPAEPCETPLPVLAGQLLGSVPPVPAAMPAQSRSLDLSRLIRGPPAAPVS